MTSSGSPLLAGRHTFTVEAGGSQLTLVYYVHRSDDPTEPMKPLLIIQPPGWGIGPRYQQVSMTELEKHFTLLYIVPRGTEPSDRPPRDDLMGPWEMADDLESLRKHLGLDKLPGVLGHSNGGAIALSYAIKYPSCLERMILVDHQLIGNKHREGDVEGLWDKLKDDPRYREAVELDERFQEIAEKDMSAVTDDMHRQWLKDIAPVYFVDPEKHAPWFRQGMEEAPLSFWCSTQQGNGDARLRDPPVLIDRMSEVQAKTLVVFGKQDMVCPVRHAYRVKEEIPHAQLAVYDDCGHFPWREKPEETYRDIVDFMSS